MSIFNRTVVMIGQLRRCSSESWIVGKSVYLLKQSGLISMPFNCPILNLTIVVKISILQFNLFIMRVL